MANTINTASTGCNAGYSGQTVPASTSWAGNNASPYSTVTVTNWSNPPFQPGDTIWVSGNALFPSSLNTTGRFGGLITSVTGGTGGGFSYTATGVTNATASPLQGSVATVSALQSWPVPYETPYASAYLAFLKAAIYHYNHLTK